MNESAAKDARTARARTFGWGALVTLLVLASGAPRAAHALPLGSLFDVPHGKGPIPGAHLCDQTGIPHPNRTISLPADDAPHNGDPFNYWEWWYWTGHLTADDGRRFAFAIIFESKPQLGIQQAIYTLHDLSEGKMHYGRDALLLGRPADTTNGFALRGPHSSAVGGNGQDVLHEKVDGYDLDVSLTSLKPAVLQLDAGHLAVYCNDSFYYQRQRIAVEGTLVQNGTPVRVSGEAWFDHNWGFDPIYLVAQTDYLLFQLDDAREVFIGVARFPLNLTSPRPLELPGAVQTTIEFGTITEANGNVVQLSPEEITLTPRKYFRSSPICAYPIEFDVRVGDEQFHVAPSLVDAELRSTVAPLGNIFWQEDATIWDGEIVVSGDGTGLGWLDLVRYCPGR